MANVRIKCAKTLQSIIEGKVFFAELKNDFSEKDLPFANMLILTSLRYWTGLNEVLRVFLKKKIPNKHREAQYLLLSAIAELLLMKTASYAVINETVKNIRQVSDKFLSGLANAVLRKIADNTDFWREKLQIINPLPASFLPILKGYDSAQIEQIAQSVFVLPKSDISVKSNHEQWAKRLDAEILPNGSLRLNNAVKISALEGYESGDWWVQDVAAALPVMAMGNIKGNQVVDLCAAPGGKTAQLVAGGAEVTAVDISAERLEKLRQNMKRIGFDEKVQTVNIDALDFLQKADDEAYDAVLLDAPCSATGTFRRHPEVLHIKTENDVKQQIEIQQKLLDASVRTVKKGGIILYSVCSIAQAEGEEQIKEFLNRHNNCRILPITGTDVKIDNIIQPEGWVRTLTYNLQQYGGMDSFFICKLQRII